MSQTQVSSVQHTVDSLSSMPSTPLSGPSIADPGPIGLAGFAMTTFVLSVFNSNMLSAKLPAVRA